MTPRKRVSPPNSRSAARSGRAPPGPAKPALPGYEERFRLLVETVRDYAIFLLDPGGRVASWNPGAERIKGYHSEEIIGRHFSCFYPQEDVEAGKPDRELEAAASHGRVEDEGWHVRKDGSRFWANAVITALRDEAGTLVGFAKVTRDLTEQRRAEEALRAGEEYARRIVEAAYDAFVGMDQDGGITGWNRHAEDIFGWARADAIGRPLAETIIPTQYRHPHRRGLKHFLATGEGPVLNRVVDITAVRGDGAQFPVELTLTPLRIGGEDGFTGLLPDGPQRERAEGRRPRHPADPEAVDAGLGAVPPS